MKKILSIVAAIVLASLSLTCFAAENQGNTADIRFIKELQSPYSRVKLRDEPSREGKVLGQFYAGVEMRVLKEKKGWANVVIGEGESAPKGWMMSEFLLPKGSENQPELPRGGIVADVRVGIGLISLFDKNESATMLPRDVKNVAVLGMKNEHLLYVMCESDGKKIYGVMSALQVVNVYLPLQVVCDNPNTLVNMRDKPSRDGKVVCRLYCGTTVQSLFDNIPDDTWAYVQVGNICSGYISKNYLAPYSPESQYRPPVAEMRSDYDAAESCIIEKDYRGENDPDSGENIKVNTTFSTADPMWLLGYKTNPAGEDLCFLSTSMFVTPQCYSPVSAYVPKEYVELPSGGSASSQGTTICETPCYASTKGGEFIPWHGAGDEQLVLKRGQKVTILSSDPYIRDGYVNETAQWIVVVVAMDDGREVVAHVPAECIDFDHRLLIKEKYTEG